MRIPIHNWTWRDGQTWLCHVGCHIIVDAIQTSNWYKFIIKEYDACKHSSKVYDCVYSENQHHVKVHQMINLIGHIVRSCGALGHLKLAQ